MRRIGIGRPFHQTTMLSFSSHLNLGTALSSGSPELYCSSTKGDALVRDRKPKAVINDQILSLDQINKWGSPHNNTEVLVVCYIY